MDHTAQEVPEQTRVGRPVFWPWLGWQKLGDLGKGAMPFGTSISSSAKGGIFCLLRSFRSSEVGVIPQGPVGP